MAELAQGGGSWRCWLTETEKNNIAGSRRESTTWLYSDNARMKIKSKMEWKQTELNETGWDGNGNFF